jgi:hypothetical protein
MSILKIARLKYEYKCKVKRLSELLKADPVDEEMVFRLNESIKHFETKLKRLTDSKYAPAVFARLLV